MTLEKLVCKDCLWRGNDDGALIHPHPALPGSTISFCPKCKSVNIRLACDEPGCWEERSYSTPTPSGYRRTCHRHRPKEKDEPKTTEPRTIRVSAEDAERALNALNDAGLEVEVWAEKGWGKKIEWEPGKDFVIEADEDVASALYGAEINYETES